MGIREIDRIEEGYGEDVPPRVYDDYARSGNYFFPSFADLAFLPFSGGSGNLGSRPVARSELTGGRSTDWLANEVGSPPTNIDRRTTARINPDKWPVNPSGTEAGFRVGQGWMPKLSARAVACVGRSVRREVLFAADVVGRGRRVSKKRRRSWLSDFHCEK